MNILVIGMGSIGKRRKAILEDLGQRVLGIDVETVISDELLQANDAIFITTPPHLHMSMAMQCARLSKPFFLEKPGARYAEEMKPLVELCESSKVVNMVACNLRFTDEYAYIKNALSTVGKPVFAYAEFGYYLPFWREGNYQNYYSCYRSQGGGVVLDAIHELDYLFDLFGYPNGFISGNISNSGELQLDVEDNATLALGYPTGMTAVVHVDYLQRAYSRKFHCVGTDGTIDMTFHINKSTIMYRREMAHFLDCVKNKKVSCQTVTEHQKLLMFVDILKQGAVFNSRPR